MHNLLEQKFYNFYGILKFKFLCELLRSSVYCWIPSVIKIPL